MHDGIFAEGHNTQFGTNWQHCDEFVYGLMQDFPSIVFHHGLASIQDQNESALFWVDQIVPEKVKNLVFS